MTGSGTIWLRIDHDLVGKTLAEKLRRRMDRTGEGDEVRVVRTPRRRVASGGVV
jgi:hypothetical protein